MRKINNTKIVALLLGFSTKYSVLNHDKAEASTQWTGQVPETDEFVVVSDEFVVMQRQSIEDKQGESPKGWCAPHFHTRNNADSEGWHVLSFNKEEVFDEEEIKAEERAPEPSIFVVKVETEEATSKPSMSVEADPQLLLQIDATDMGPRILQEIIFQQKDGLIMLKWKEEPGCKDPECFTTLELLCMRGILGILDSLLRRAKKPRSEVYTMDLVDDLIGVTDFLLLNVKEPTGTLYIKIKKEEGKFRFIRDPETGELKAEGISETNERDKSILEQMNKYAGRGQAIALNREEWHFSEVMANRCFPPAPFFLHLSNGTR